MIILAIIESILAKNEKISKLLIDFSILFLMIFHLFLFSYCLFYEKVIVYMSKYFLIYIYILEVCTFRKNVKVLLDLKGET